MLVLLCAGCPKNVLNPQNLAFTSADRSSGNALYDNTTGATAGTTTETSTSTERTVVEPDVIRRVGNLMYVLNQYRGLTIVDLDTDKLVAQAPTYGYPRDLYLVGNRAYVLVGYASKYTVKDNTISIDLGSKLYVLDVSAPAQTSIISTFDLSGDFIDSRMVGDVLYALNSQYTWSWDTSGGVVSTSGTTTSAASGSSSGSVGAARVSPASVTKQATSSSTVTSVDLADPANIHVVDTLSLDGYGSTIQATPAALFVAASDWNTNLTTITYVDIADPAGKIAVRGNIAVQGYVADQYKMDAWNGVLRVVSNTSWMSRNVYVTTVDLANPDALKALGETAITDAAGETLFATRFDGPRAYIVTYYMKDPLFILDLSDPTKPALAGKLEVPGWSTYIEPQGDRLVALGVDDSDSQRRISISLFDVADATKPALLDRKSFGENWSWSSAYSDVKALTVLDDAILVPFSGWTDTGGFERLQILGYTHDTLTLDGYVDVRGDVVRSFEYGANYYAVTNEQLAVIDASDPTSPTVTKTVTLAENLVDYLELSATVGVELLTRYEDGSTTLRTVAPDGAVLGEITTDIGSYRTAFVRGASVVLVGTEWDSTSGNSFYRVVAADCSTAAAPAIAVDLKVDVQPYWGYYWWNYYGGVMPMVAEAATATSTAISSIAMPYYYWWPWGGASTDSAFLTDKILTLRCSASAYDSTIGSATATQGLALVDLDQGAVVTKVGLGYDAVTSVNQTGNLIYIGTKQSAGADSAGRAYCAYFLQAFNPVTVQAGTAVNVPGDFLQYDPASKVLTLLDTQYKTDGVWTVTRVLNTVSWDGGAAITPLSNLTLSDNAGTLKAAGAKIYFDAWDQGTVLGSVTVGADGALAFGSKVTVGSGWAYLTAAQGGNAYVIVNGGAIAQYNFAGDPALKTLVQVMNAPNRIRFGAAAAYAPLGYAGLAVLPY
jgi:hypothetical protein